MSLGLLLVLLKRVGMLTPNSSVICIIGTLDRLPAIRCLAQSYHQYNNEQIYALIVLANNVSEEKDFKVLSESDVGVTDTKWMADNYSALEYSTALKPILLKQALCSYNKVCYFDSDIVFYDSISSIWDALDEYDIVLTPHLLGDLDDLSIPNERNILLAGMFNAGFIGLKQSKNAFDFLKWWSNRLYRNCFMLPAEGMVADQKWLDFVPYRFQKVKILSDPGCNMAYWDFKNRHVSVNNGKWHANGSTLKFLHFSGYTPTHHKQISKYQTRYTFETLPTVDLLFKNYANQLYLNGYKDTIKPVGINIAGFMSGDFGLAQGGKCFVKAIQSVNIPHTIQSVEVGQANINNDFPGRVYGINFDTTNYHNALDRSLFGYYNIGLWLWELEDCPPEWAINSKYFNEIWTPTKFCRTAIQKIVDVPVYTISQSVSIEDCNFKLTKRDFDLPDCYTFCFVFDFGSSMDRKNPDGVVKAFLKAFKDRKDVSLVLKTSSSSSCPTDYQRLREVAGSAPNIFFIDKCLSRPDVLGLINCCDCYISLHRSEGFGLTIAEAMGLGKPTISTNYSGSVDFAKEDTAFVVGYKMISSPANCMHYGQGHLWADPNIDEASQIMEFVMSNSTTVIERAKAGKNFIDKYHSFKASGDHLLLMLRRITGFDNDHYLSQLTKDMGDIGDPFAHYLTRGQHMGLECRPNCGPFTRKEKGR